MHLGLWALFAISVLKGISLLVSYISNNAFPKPLSEEEEAIYLTRMKKGDEEARHILIEHNLRLVAHIIKKFESTGEEMDDLISIGTIGLIKAINTFDRNKGTKLATYAARCIENEILKSRTEHTYLYLGLGVRVPQSSRLSGSLKRDE